MLTVQQKALKRTPRQWIGYWQKKIYLHHRAKIDMYIEVNKELVRLRNQIKE